MKKVFFFLVISLLFHSLSAQFTIKGIVISAIDYSAVSNASITLNNNKGSQVQKVYSDARGLFVMQKVTEGNYVLQVYAGGFKTASLDIGIKANKLDIIFELKQLQVVSDEVIVESIKNKKPFNASHTNLNSDDINSKNLAQDLPVILNTTASAVSTSDAGAGVGYSGVRIRGVDATRVNVTINGVPFNDAESHGVFWVDLPDLAGNVNAIQIQRGIGSSTNGGAAFGSSINIQTTKSSADPYAIYSSVFGTYNTFKNSLKFGTGLIKNHWTCEGSVSSILSDGYIERASSNLKSGYGTIARYGDKSLLKFIVMQGKEVTYQSWYGVIQDSMATNRRHNPYTYKNQTDNYTQTHLQLLYTYALNPKLNLNTVLHYTKGKGYYENYNAVVNLSDYGMPDFKIIDTSITQSDIIDRKWLDNDFAGIVTSAVYKGKKLELNAGASFNNYLGRHYHEVIWSDIWTAPKPGGNFEPFRYYNDKGIKNDGNAYLKVFYNPTPKITIFGDAQVRPLSYNFNDALGKNVTKKYLFFNPKAGLSFALADSSSILLYLGRSAHEPTRDEFVSSTAASLPKAEFLNDMEIGYSKWLKGWNFSANYYLMNYTNQLVLTGRLNDVGSPVRENVKSSFRSGIELMAQGKFKGGLSVNANLTFAKSKIRNYKEYIYNYNYDSATVFEYDATPISFSPDLIASASIKYTARKHYEIEVISKYVSEQFLDNSGNMERKLEAYFVHDLYLRYHFSSTRLTSDMNVNFVLYNFSNILYSSNGATYAAMNNGVRETYNYYYPQAPMHFALMLQVKL